MSNKAERDKRIVGKEKMERVGEFENWLNGKISNPSSSSSPSPSPSLSSPSPNSNRRNEDRFVSSGSIYGRGYSQFEYSHPNSGFGFSMNGSSYSAPLEEEETNNEYQWSNAGTQSSLNSNPSYSQAIKDLLVLPENFHRMNIEDKQKEGLNFRGFGGDPDGFRLGNGNDGPLGGVINGQCEDFYNGPFDYEAYLSSNTNGFGPVSFDGDTRFTPLTYLPSFNVGDETSSPLTHTYPSSRNSSPAFNDNRMSNVLFQTQEQDGGRYYREVQPQNPISRPYTSGDFVCSHGLDSNGAKGLSLRGSFSSPHLLQPKREVNMSYCPLHNNLSTMKGKAKANPIGCEVTPVFNYNQYAGDLEGFSCEDSFILEGQCLSDVTQERKYPSYKKNSHNGFTMSNGRDKSFGLDCHYPFGKICEDICSSSSSDLQFSSPLRFWSLNELRDSIYFMAKDQSGCRKLQKLFLEGTSQDVQMLFNEVIDHVVELSTNPYGNYLLQKLLDVCSEEQRLQIVLKIIYEPGCLVRISFNTHGTRVVQKMIETSRHSKQLICSIMSVLEPSFLELFKDDNGMHVVNRCLNCLSNEDNMLIIDAAIKFCIDMATDKHGCCVLQTCFLHSMGRLQLTLVTKVLQNARYLAQDQYGNFVLQCIVDLRIPYVNAELTSQFEGHYVYFSMQKFSSHVVEKFLKALPQSRPKIINELLSVSQFDQLLQDLYANYVIKTALDNTQGDLHDLLVRAIQPHMALRTLPCCKKIFSHILQRK